MKKFLESVAERVRRGAKRYDSIKPEWWTKKNLDLAVLDESDPRRSVAGQNATKESLHSGRMWDGTWDYRVLGFASQLEAVAEGFYFTVDEHGFSRGDWDTRRENELLTEAWRHEIHMRRKARDSS